MNDVWRLTTPPGSTSTTLFEQWCGLSVSVMRRDLRSGHYKGSTFFSVILNKDPEFWSGQGSNPRPPALAVDRRSPNWANQATVKRGISVNPTDFVDFGQQRSHATSLLGSHLVSGHACKGDGHATGSLYQTWKTADFLFISPLILLSKPDIRLFKDSTVKMTVTFYCCEVFRKLFLKSILSSFFRFCFIKWVKLRA